MKADAMALLERLRTVYGLPNGVDDESLPDFFGEYVNAIQGFDARTLRKAGDHLLRTSKFWPRPAEIVDVAEQYLPSQTVYDSQAHKIIRENRDAFAKAARDYMTQCPSSLVDMALRQGWGRSLEDVARDVVRKCYERDGRMPTWQMMQAFRIPQTDVDYYRRYGQSHLDSDTAEIIEARKQSGAAQDITSRMMGEGGEAA